MVISRPQYDDDDEMRRLEIHAGVTHPTVPLVPEGRRGVAGEATVNVVALLEAPGRRGRPGGPLNIRPDYY